MVNTTQSVSAKTANIPKWVGKHLDPSALTAIEQAIQAAETQTSGEIVPVVMQHSIPLDHIPLLSTLILLTTFLAADGLHWQALWLSPSPLWLILDVLVAGLIGYALAQLKFIQRFLTAQHAQMNAVHTAAQAAFLTSGLAHTKRATGVLIFVSLLERRTVILADAAIMKQLPENTWNGVVAIINNAIRSDSLGKGLVKGIQEIATLLAEFFPHREGNANEAPDRLVFLDPSHKPHH